MALTSNIEDYPVSRGKGGILPDEPAPAKHRGGNYSQGAIKELTTGADVRP
jgi:hypothetical protein